jgi:hypothetical protein
VRRRLAPLAPEKSCPVADIPDTIVLKRDRDLAGRNWEIWLRRGLFALLPAVVVLALVNLFGQRPSSSTRTSAAAALKLYAPSRVRGGLLFQARFHVSARRDLKKAVLVLDPGWLEGMTVNTIEPAPVNEASRNGRLSLDLGHIPAGGSHLLFIQFQVNPTNVGHRRQTAQLFDGETKLLQLDHTITVFP